MTVQELLKAAPRDEFLDCFIPYRFDNVKPEDAEEVRKGLEKWIGQLLERESNKTDSVLLAHISYVEEARFAVSVVHRNEIEAWIRDGMRIEAPDSDDPATAYPKLPPIYGIPFADWNEILGLQVDMENVSEYGINRFLSEVLLEMSFVGFHEGEMIRERDELISRADRLSAMSPEERKAQCRPADEVFRELAERFGFEYHEDTPEEIEERHRRIGENVRREYAERYRVMKAYVRHRRMEAEDG